MCAVCDFLKVDGEVSDADVQKALKVAALSLKTGEDYEHISDVLASITGQSMTPRDTEAEAAWERAHHGRQ